MLVRHNSSDLFVLDLREVNSLKADALAHPTGRARLCMHRSPEDPVQNMVLALSRRGYIQPHRHVAGKSELYHVIEGLLDIFFWDEGGKLFRRVRLGPWGSGLPGLYHLSSRIWHMPVAASDVTVYHETFTGPFRKFEDVEYASWAPVEGDTVKQAEFVEAIERSLPLVQSEAGKMRSND